MRLTRVVIGIAFVLAACDSSSASSVNHPATPSPTTSVSALLVFTTWVPDSKVTNGAEPGYKPALSDLTGHDVQSVTAVIDNTGTSWVLNISFTPRGTTLFAMLTRANVAACAGDPATGAGYGCPQRHLAVWLDLTQADIDSWGDAAYVAKVSQQYDLRCLSPQSATSVCPKLVSDPITLQEIDGGRVIVDCSCDQSRAKELADATNAIAHS
jgi:preprotein translocase subunit SecD